VNDVHVIDLDSPYILHVVMGESVMGKLCFPCNMYRLYFSQKKTQSKGRSKIYVSRASYQHYFSKIYLSLAIDSGSNQAEL
jgi:hypothetical protein